MDITVKEAQDVVAMNAVHNHPIASYAAFGKANLNMAVTVAAIKISKGTKDVKIFADTREIYDHL